MRPAVLLIITFIFLSTSCSEEEPAVVCESIELTESVSISALSGSVSNTILDRFIDYPDLNGALGPNKESYIHVRAQSSMTYLAEYAVRNQDEDVLKSFVDNLNYSFSYQKEAGDFEFVTPPDAPSNQAPPADRLAHETAIFGYSLGYSLVILESSDWYTQLAADQSSKLAITNLSNEISAVYTFLKNNVELLKMNGANSPSRTLYNISSIFLLSGYLKDEEGGKLALPMLESVFAAHNNSEGYFTEAEGWDSSYNGESIKLGLELYALLAPMDHPDLRTSLAGTMTCAANWQKTRILETGEISTEGNSLIYPGGETIGSREKKVDFEKTVRAFKYMSYLSGDTSFSELSDLVLSHYNNLFQ